MEEQIRAVIYDMGGVILRSESYAPRIALAKAYGLTRKELETLIFDSESSLAATVGQISAEAHWNTVAQKLGVPPQRLDEFQRDFWSGDRLDVVLVEFLGSLRPMIKTGLLSNAWPGARENLMENYSCRDVFDVSVFSYEVGLAKPDQAIFDLILTRLQVKPQETVFLDDNAENIEAAKVMGIHAIRFTGREQALQEMRALL